MSHILGIDLGTTEFVYGHHGGGDRGHSERGRRAHNPSVVAFAKNGERLVARPPSARSPIRKIRCFPPSASSSQISEVREEAKKFPFKVVEGKKRRRVRRVQAGDKWNILRPQQFPRWCSGKMKADAEAYLGEKIARPHHVRRISTTRNASHKEPVACRPRRCSAHQQSPAASPRVWPRQEEG